MPDRDEVYSRYLEFPSLIKGGAIEPHWMADGKSFWYADGIPSDTAFYMVDPKSGVPTPLFDTDRLRSSISKELGHALPGRGLPFESFEFLDDLETTVRLKVNEHDFVLDLNTHALKRIVRPSQASMQPVPRTMRARLDELPVVEMLSPDGKWFLGVKDHNLLLRPVSSDVGVPLTTDGIEGHEWVEKHLRRSRWAWWSTDSSKVAVKKEDSRRVPLVPVVDWLARDPQVTWVRYPRAGGDLFRPELFIIDIETKRQVRVDLGDQFDGYVQIIGWLPDGSELLFVRMDRIRKNLELVAAGEADGSTRVLLEEESKTFVAGFEFNLADAFTLLEDGKRFIWVSQRDGWKHLYLYDLTGRLIRRLTMGEYPVTRVVTVNENDGWVCFIARSDEARPYDTHLHRVSLEGGNLKRLTETTGHHEIRFSPSKEFFLDTHSTVERPPVVELRRADGKLVQTVSKANIDAVKELGWVPPEEFVVTAADGKTKLHGILIKPYDFDPNYRYPVIEHIYGGPQVTIVPRTFASHWSVDEYFHARALAQLGFIVFLVDGRGTPGRGKAFQDVVYRRFGRHEIPDHVGVLQQLALRRPYMDLNRVGIIGGSWGGYFAIRAMLLAPEVYHVAVADAPDVDFYHDGPHAYEAYMGLPQDNAEGYDYGSNLLSSEKLKGKLLLVAGTNDAMVFAGTMRMAGAFVEAGRAFDLLVLPGQPHDYSGSGAAYFRDAVRRYFEEHLRPVDNAPASSVGGHSRP